MYVYVSMSTLHNGQQMFAECWSEKNGTFLVLHFIITWDSTNNNVQLDGRPRSPTFWVQLVHSLSYRWLNSAGSGFSRTVRTNAAQDVRANLSLTFMAHLRRISCVAVSGIVEVKNHKANEPYTQATDGRFNAMVV